MATQSISKTLKRMDKVFIFARGWMGAENEK
jgi:hypothetical protein